jgi:D-cysteine desulfhydrase
MLKSDQLQDRLLCLDRMIERQPLAQLPTPVCEFNVSLAEKPRTLHVKLDNLTSDHYGGNKVRKLEYILHQARRHRCERVATFGTVGSHHALATAIFAARHGLPCTCFLSHQRATADIRSILGAHLQLGTEVVHFGGQYQRRLAILRKHLWGHNPWVIPPGGTSWLGTTAFVRAGLELACQVAAGMLPAPHRLYVATGTMGTAAGLALGLALSGLATEVHAIRVSHTWLCNERDLARTMRKAVSMIRRVDCSVPANLHERVNIRLRHEFFAGGYAHGDRETATAIDFAADQLGLALEVTYTGKAMAALLHDLRQRSASGSNCLFWNTCNSAKLQLPDTPARGSKDLPVSFRRYLS